MVTVCILVEVSFYIIQTRICTGYCILKSGEDKTELK